MPLPPDLAKPVFKLFPEMADRVMNSLCVICDTSIVHGDFRDAISKKEYGISGLCQECQDGVFGVSEQPEEPNWDA